MHPVCGVFLFGLCGLGYILQNGGEIQLNLQLRPLKAIDAIAVKKIPENGLTNGEEHEKLDRQSVAGVPQR